MRTGIASAVKRMGKAAVRRSILTLLILLLLVGCGGGGGDSQDRPQSSPEQLGQAFTIAVYEGEFDQATGYVVPAFRSAAQSSLPGMQTTLQRGGFQRVESTTAVDYDVGMKKVFVKGGTWTGQLLVVQQGTDWYVQDILGWTISPAVGSTQEVENTPLPPTSKPTVLPSPTPVDTVDIAATVAVQGDYAYVGEGFTLAVVDVSDPVHPVVVGRTERSRGSINDVVVAGKWVYLTAGVGGLRIIDISDPTTPVEVGFYETNWYAFQVTPMGKYVQVADDSNLVLIDLANPEVPKKVDSYSPGNRTCARAAAGTATDKYAYIVYRNALVILDLASEPPSVVGEYKYVGDYSMPICMNGIAVMENLAYATDDKGGILILDVGAPTKPRKLAWHRLTNPDSGILPSPAESIAVAGKYAYVSFRTEVRVLDLADPVAPVEVGAYQVPQGNSVFAVHALDVVVSGQYAYLACEEAGLIILDVSDPAAPVEVKP